MPTAAAFDAAPERGLASGNPAPSGNTRKKPLRFLDRMAADSARRSMVAKSRSSQWASVGQSEWAAAQKRDAIRPTRKALRQFKARQQADISRRHEQKATTQTFNRAPAGDPKMFFVARRMVLRQPPRFEATGRTLDPGESVLTGERRVHGDRMYAETDRGGWIALRGLSAFELRAAAVRQAATMTTELLAGEHGVFAVITPVLQLLRNLSRSKLALVAEAATATWRQLGDASTEANSSQLIGLPRPPEVSDVGTLSRWLIALGESLVSAMRAGVPYALLGERLPASHKLFQQRQWSSDDLSAPESRLKRDFRDQLANAVAKPPENDVSFPHDKSSQPNASVGPSVGGYDEYGDEGFEDDDDDVDIDEAASTSAQLGAQAESRQATNFFSRLDRGALGRAERSPEQSVHRPLEIVDQESRAEEKFAPVIGPSWKKHQLSWGRWALSNDVVARMDRDSKSRNDKELRQRTAAAAVEAAKDNAAALSARAEFVCAEQQFYIHRKGVASTWNRQMRVRVETAPVASGPLTSIIVSIDSLDTVGHVATRVASEMSLRPPPSATTHHESEDDQAVWTLARGAEVLDAKCTVAQCGVLPQTTLALVPVGTKNGGSLRNDFAVARRAHDVWLRRQESQDERWKQRAQQRPRRNSAPQLAIDNTEMSVAVLGNTKTPRKVKRFLTRVAEDAKRREQATESRQQLAKLAVKTRSAISTSVANSFSRRPSSVTAISPRLTKTARLRAEAIEAAAKAATKAERKFALPGRRRGTSAPRERPPPATLSAASGSIAPAANASVSVRTNRAAQLRSVSGAARREAPAPAQSVNNAAEPQTNGKNWHDQALVEEYGGPLLAH